MKYIFIFIILCMASFCHAQKLHRHEVTVGYFGGYFFDDIGFRRQNLRVNKRMPTVSYLFRFNKSFNISLIYGNHDYGGIKLKKREDLLNLPNSLIGRIIKHRTLRAGYRINLKKSSVNLFSGITYRKGYKVTYLYTINHGYWLEPFFESLSYDDIGTLFELSVQHPIYHNFFGEITINYTKYFSDFDQNFLMPGYKIGYRF